MLGGHGTMIARGDTRVLGEILEELRAIRRHLDRSRWLGPEGAEFLNRLREQK